MILNKIFLLEDNFTLNETIKEFLETSGYQVTSVFNGLDAENILYEEKFDILLLDVNIPDINGFDILKRARKNNNLSPAIFITSLDGIEDLEKGFKSGCDDYIKKPFSLKELKIRIDTLIKRSFSHQYSNLMILNENIKFNIDTNELIIDNKIEQLGNKESILLKLFLKNSNKIIPHKVIYNELWSFDEEYKDTVLRTYIKNLRNIIGKEKIISIKKSGYKFNMKLGVNSYE